MHSFVSFSSSDLRLLAAAMGATAALAGCGGAEAEPTVVEQTVQAAGGQAALQALESMDINASGERFDPGQVHQLGDPARPVGTFDYRVRYDAATDSWRLDWERDAPYPFALSLSYAEVTTTGASYVNGADVFLASGDSPLEPAKISAVRRQQQLLRPTLLVRRMALQPEAVSVLADQSHGGRDHHVLELADGAHSVRLFVDAATFLPSKLETLEADPIAGDVTVAVTYDDWRGVAGLQVPHAVSLSFDGEVIHSETSSAIATNTVDGVAFEVPEPFAHQQDEAASHIGDCRSQWFHRAAAMGLKLDDMAQAEVVLNDIGPGLVHLTGSLHHSLAVEMSDAVVLVEAPIDHVWTEKIVAALEQRFSGKPISHVINTHFHDDHSGGLRTLVAMGATVVTAAVNEQHFSEVFEAPHTLVPDALATSPTPYTIEAVGSEPFSIDDGTRQVVVYPLATTHVQGNLVAYVPDAGVLFESDLYAPPLPGGNPAALIGHVSELYDGIVALGINVQTIAPGHGLDTAPFSDLEALVTQ